MNKIRLWLTSIMLVALVLTPVFAKPIEKPDLVVKDMNIRTNNGILSVEVIVKNQGKAPVFDFLTLNVDIETPSGAKGGGGGVYVCTDPKNNPCKILGPGESVRFQFGTEIKEKGLYKINAVVDQENRVDEVSEGNNRRFRAVNIR